MLEDTMNGAFTVCARTGAAIKPFAHDGTRFRDQQDAHPGRTAQ